MADHPSKEELFSQLRVLESSVYNARNRNFEQDSRYYELLFKDDLGLPEEYKEDGVVLPTVRDIVDAGTDHISTVHARFSRPLRGNEQVDRDQAEMLRKFDTGMFYRTKVEAETSPWRVAAKHGMMYGMWCFESVYDPDRWPEEPVRESGEDDDDFETRHKRFLGDKHEALPIHIRAIYPGNVFPDPAEGQGNFMFIKETKTIAAAKAEWPNWMPPGGMTEVVQVTWWSRTHRGIWVNQEPVLTQENDGILPHDYGFIPYVIGYSGLGSLDRKAAPGIRAVGLIRYLKKLLASESFAYSVYNIIMKHGAWPITFASGPGAAAVTQLKLKYGKIYEKPVGVTFEPYVQAPPPDTVLQHLAYTSQVLSAASPRTLRGLPEKGVRSGTDRAMLIGQARLKYGSVLEQMQLSTAKVMSNCTKIAERVVPGNIHVWARTPTDDIDLVLEKSKIKGHYTTYVEFASASPEEEARRHADMMNLIKSGAISEDTGRRRYMSHIDPDCEEIKVAAQRLRNSPQVQQIMAQIVAMELQQEHLRIVKLRMLKQAQEDGTLSMPGGAQLLSQQMRQLTGTTPSPEGGADGQTLTQPSRAGAETPVRAPQAFGGAP